MATPQEAPRVMSGQDRRFLACFTEHFPFHSVPVELKQLFIEDRSGQKWTLLAQQMSLNTKAEVSPKSFTINCDAGPLIPRSWKVLSHRQHGMLAFNKEKFSDPKYLYLSEGQKNGKFLKGTLLQKELKDLPVMNACVLDCLLDTPDQIPESFNQKVIFFWGTIYRGSDGNTYVRSLYRDGSECFSSWHLLDNGWDGNSPALLAS